jgi:hypothetical protein
MVDFVKVDTYILEQDYSVRYNDGRGLKKFKTQLILIGSKEECDEHERTIIEYGIDEGVDSNKSKAQSSKAKQAAKESKRQGSVSDPTTNGSDTDRISDIRLSEIF